MTANTAVAGQRISAAFLNSNIPGAWTAITPQNSWTSLGVGHANFQARLYNSVTVEVIGILQGGTGTNTANGTLIGTLPAGMVPAAIQAVNGVLYNPNAVAGGSFQVAIATSGAMQIYGVPSTTTQISFHFFVSLDA